MVAIDTMAIGGSWVAKDLLHVRILFILKNLIVIVYLQQMEENSEYKSYKIITLNDDPPANCLWINGTVLHIPLDRRYKQSIQVNIIQFIFDNKIKYLLYQTLTSRLGPTVSDIELLNSEFAKIDCVLSNRCLLFNRSKENTNNDR